MTEVPESDREVGIEAYASKGPPCPATLRETNEDFRVEESLRLTGFTEESRPDYYPLYRVEKRAIDTMHMERELAEELRSKVSFGGLKDKKAVAVQFVTPTSLRSQRPKVVSKSRFSATLVGYVPKPVSRGSVSGNKFTIVLRRCCPAVEANIAEVFSLGAEKRMPNYFGHQRFGARGGRTHLVGRAIVRRDFQGAVRLLLNERRVGDDEDTREAREEAGRGNFDAALRLLPRGQDTERLVAAKMAAEPQNFVGALRGAPIRLRRLFVHAYQSFIFNRTLSLGFARGLDISTYQVGDNWTEGGELGAGFSPIRGVREQAIEGAVPMVQLAGYAFRDYGSRFDALVKEVMESEGVSAKDFYVEGMEEASAEGGFRIPHLVVGEPRHEVLGETATLGFSLARGQYATVLVREIVKTDGVV